MNGSDRKAEDMAARDAAAAMERERRARADADARQEAEEEAEIEDRIEPTDDAPASGWQAPPDAADGPDYEAVIGALQDELEQARDQRMRAAAEMENLRRRTAREIADAKKYAVSSFARDLLSVSDNLTRALSVVSDEEAAKAGEVWKNLLEGVQMTERELLSALQKNGVTQIDPEGERFDPNRHQAMFEVPDPSKPNGTVVQVVAPGFLIGDRVLRPAMVGVSRGGPKVEARPEGSAAAPDAAPGETVDRSA